MLTSLRTHGRTDELTERRKLYTPRHTSYAGGITIEARALKDDLIKFLIKSENNTS